MGVCERAGRKKKGWGWKVVEEMRVGVGEVGVREAGGFVHEKWQIPYIVNSGVGNYPQTGFDHLQRTCVKQ
jgi:hypothetical protein